MFLNVPDDGVLADDQREGCFYSDRRRDQRVSFEAGKHSAGRCQHDAVEPAKAGPARLTSEDLQLMAQDEDLDVL
jgi:hypothetical protein